jgi:hypothetical protein
MLNGLYDVLIVTDVTNYFDSINHELLMEYLSPLGLPRKAVGLLGRILEEFKPPAGHSPNPRIGIPVDEFDCSRQLAHVFLFEHDRRVVENVGEEYYVRWMDDQNIGAMSMTGGRQIVRVLNTSLSSQRLTLNAGKTLFLTQDQIVKHFQLLPNEALDSWETSWKERLEEERAAARGAFESLWIDICARADREGHWDKVLKRAYSIATKVDSAALESRAYEDLITFPELASRIFMYYAQRNRTDQLTSLFREYCDRGESLYEATEAMFFESCLLLDCERASEATVVTLARQFANGELKGQTGRPYGKASALLALYWFSAQKLEIGSPLRGTNSPNLPGVVARALLAITAARQWEEFSEVQADLVGNPSDDVARLSRFLTSIRKGTIESVGPYRSLKPRWPREGKFYDARAWLQLEIISKSPAKSVRHIAQQDLKSFTKFAQTRQELRCLRRIQKTLQR